MPVQSRLCFLVTHSLESLHPTAGCDLLNREAVQHLKVGQTSSDKTQDKSAQIARASETHLFSLELIWSSLNISTLRIHWCSRTAHCVVQMSLGEVVTASQPARRGASSPARQPASREGSISILACVSLCPPLPHYHRPAALNPS